MFNAEDLVFIEERGSDLTTVKEQVRNFEQGFPYLEIIQAATIGKGIIQLNEDHAQQFIDFFEHKLEKGISLLKFVPASGAASRMFKSLFTAKARLENGTPEKEVLQDKEVQCFFNGLKKFAFYADLERLTGKPVEQLSALEVLNLVLTEQGLNYGNLPKGLLKFHQYQDHSRTSFEEHCAEGALYAKDQQGKVQMHFTVSPEHKPVFEAHLKAIKSKYEKLFGVHYEVSFSQQKPATDTIAVDLNNKPFRNGDNSLLFRPGGHGALIDNLNDLDADLIFIKNIDNVVPDYLKAETIKYKKALAGLLLNYQKRIFNYQRVLDERHYTALDSKFYAEASAFLENVLNVKPPTNQYYAEKEELYHYLKSKFNRPIRVCGMVKNEGEPGGGPFWAKNADESISLQVVESSQINLEDKKQADIVKHATHFNPVDLICGTKNYLEEPYDLLLLRDPRTGFISYKSKDGKELKAQELPGLWNGAMADWNTLFVEVPILTFNPVKTVNDLLRKEHQPD
ncbi:DUF4301 family protein [uncultured Sunxiuqinia sp.]|uniref:DUF4301 family protein n=1 Tax=uncultured Sunxiuqinia sp. TaxID=1573825 RepID=UPI00260D2E66|nr:DUF4301 family protein [uncultured Sunxiuqinia sp.]